MMAKLRSRLPPATAHKLTHFDSFGAGRRHLHYLDMHQASGHLHSSCSSIHVPAL